MHWQLETFIQDKMHFGPHNEDGTDWRHTCKCGGELARELIFDAPHTSEDAKIFFEQKDHLVIDWSPWFAHHAKCYKEDIQRWLNDMKDVIRQAEEII